MMTDKELKDFLNEHFVYEVQVLCEAIAYLINPLRDRNVFFEYIVLEGFVFHSRNVVEFIFHDKKHPDDSRSRDFISESDFSILKNNYNDDLKSFYKRASKEVGHLTYSRISGTPEEKKWDCGHYYGLILRAIKDFLAYLPNKYKGNNINRLDFTIDILLKTNK